MNKQIKYKIIDAKINKQLISDEISMNRITDAKNKKPNKPTQQTNMNGYATINYVDQKFDQLDKRITKTNNATINYVDQKFDQLDKRITETNNATLSYVDQRFNELENDVNNKFTNIDLQLKQIINIIINK